MKQVILGLAVSFATVSAANAITFLQCEGYDTELPGKVVHSIEINEATQTAILDDVPYSLYATATSFQLRGPLGNNPATDTSPPIYVEINRIDGRYFVLRADSNGQPRDRSRAQDAGCQAVMRKF